MKLTRTISADYDFEIPFYDLDPMKIVWHGNYIKYFEEARCRLLRLFDYDYPQMEQSGYFWPIIDLRLKYVSPARFGQQLRCTATLVEIENRMKIEYAIYDRNNLKKLTKGYSIQVAITTTDHEMQLISPKVLKQKIEHYCGELK
ncbi:MAG: acyl-CoA thioesterase [Kangiellaceae bacterium]|nr:acyl-CoA thioesterase [Kangiellaceae bacterium]